MDNNMVLYGIFILIVVVLFLNVIKVFINLFTRSKRKKEVMAEVNTLREEIREEINKKVKPHLTSLEGMYEKSESSEKTFSSFVFSAFKDKLSTVIGKNEKLVESEICKCCGEYEGSECKESFCLESSGISCPKA